MKNSIKTLDQLNNRLRGYAKTFRGKFLLLQRGLLTPSEFILLDLSFLVLADWDKGNHPDTYGTFGHTLKEIGQIIGWSPSTVSRSSRALFQNGFWLKEPNGRIRVAGFNITENLAVLTKEVGLIDLRNYISGTQKPVVKPQENIAKMNDNTPKDGNGDDWRLQPEGVSDIADTQSQAPKGLGVAFKGESNLLRSDEEYLALQKEHPGLTIDDMKWIDLNVKEDAAPLT